MVGVRLILLKASVAMGELSVRIVVPMAMKKLPNGQRFYDTTWRGAYPKVAAEPIMYWPNVRSIPFGPGPKRTMLVKPGKSEWVSGRAGYAHQI
jgi:hypothetical protein